MSNAALVRIALLICFAGVAYKVWTWFSYSLGSTKFTVRSRVLAAARGMWQTLWSRQVLTILKAFVLNVLFQSRLLRVAPLKWAAHFLILTGFTMLLLMHALGDYLNPLIFSNYYSTLNPFLFLRNLFGVLILTGLGIALFNRFIRRDPARPPTSLMDVYTLAIFAAIVVSGIVLESVKITSVSVFREMAEEYAAGQDEASLKSLEAYWVENYGVVSPRLAGPFSPEVLAEGKSVHSVNCAQCHSPARWAFMDYAVSRLATPVAVYVDGDAVRATLYYFHFLICLLGLACLPFSKVFHLFTSPICILANAVMDRVHSDPANLMTKQILELDACTHCGTCTRHCSMAFIHRIIPNANILPSERLVSLKLLASGHELSVRDSLVIQDGLNLCTNCKQCTLVCPVGINLQELWFSVRETLVVRDIPNLLVLSPFSIYRGMWKDDIEITCYNRAISQARKAIADEFDSSRQPRSVYEPEEERVLDAPGIHMGQDTCADCFRCMTCTNACPVVRAYAQPGQDLDLLPHQLMQAVRLRLWNLVFSSRMLWECLGCYKCQEYCPMSVPATDLIFALRNVAISRTSRNIFQKTLGTL
ncbi:MAG: 4Fe-4S dicluster domain-containing protein [Syntrophobacteraceae bacterium]|jgi:heterodisulfide reductase subunit C